MATNRTSVSIVGPLSGEYDESVYVIRRLSWKARSQGYCFPSLPSIKGCSDFFNYLPGFWIYESIKRCTGIYFLAVWKSILLLGKLFCSLQEYQDVFHAILESHSQTCDSSGIPYAAGKIKEKRKFRIFYCFTQSLLTKGMKIIVHIYVGYVPMQENHTGTTYILMNF